MDLEYAIQLHKLQRYAEAKSAYETLTEKNPEDTRLLYLYGCLLFDLKKYALAKTTLLTIFQRDPKHAPALCTLGHIARAEFQFDVAEAYYKQAIAMDASCEEAYLGMGSLRQYLGDFKAMRVCFEQAWKQMPHSVELLAKLGESLALLGHVDSARAALDELERVNPAHHSTKLLAATIASQVKDWEQAEQGFRYLLERIPWSPLPHAYLGDVFLEKGQIRWALSAYSSASGVAPEMATASWRAANCALKLNEKRQALRHLMELMQHPHPEEEWKATFLKVDTEVRAMPQSLSGMHTFRHKPKLGDVILGLPFIRAMGGGVLYLDPSSSHFAGEEDKWTSIFNELAVYLKTLPYIHDCCVWSGQPFDYDMDWYMDTSHLVVGDRVSITENHFRAFGKTMRPADYEPWLASSEKKQKGFRVVSNSARQHAPHSDYQFLLEDKGPPFTFVGTESEYQRFLKRSGMSADRLRYHATPRISDLIDTIAKAELFIGNQSFPHSIASALRVPRIVELGHPYPNGLLNTPEETLLPDTRMQEGGSQIAVPGTLLETIDRVKNFRSKGKLEPAVMLLKEALKKWPQAIELYLDQARIAQQLGKDDAVMANAKEVLVRKPMHREACTLLARIYGKRGMIEDAIQAWKHCLKIDNNHQEARVAYTKALRDAGEIEAYERALKEMDNWYVNMPDGSSLNVQAILLAASLHADRKEWNKASKLYAITLRYKPDDYVIKNYYAYTLFRSNQLKDASIHYEVLCEMRPKDAVNYFPLFQIYLRSGDALLALKVLRKWASEIPKDPNAWYNLGLHEETREKRKEAFRKGITLNPEMKKLLNCLLYEHLFYPMPDASCIHELLAEADAYYRSVPQRPISHYPHLEAKTPVLRVGIVSSDFREHPVAYFTESLLGSFDASRIHLTIYDRNVFDEDATSRRFASSMSNWRKAVKWDDDQFYTEIQKDRIQLLVDLNGHTISNSLQVLAKRPAPVQVAYLGYPMSTGLRAIDYWMGDAFVMPEGTVEPASEKRYRLPRCWKAYTPPDVDAHKLHPSLHSLVERKSKDTVLLGSFNDRQKLNNEVNLNLWTSILRRIPNSRLLIQSNFYESVRHEWVALKKAFKDHDLDESRIDFVGNLNFEDHMHLIREVDFALDSVPRPGGTTTAHCLWMGTPVLTLAGDLYMERISAGVLMGAGLREWIAYTHAEYVDKAVAFSENIEAVREQKRGLRDVVLNSELCDARGLADAMTGALEDMWREYQSCAGVASV